MNEQTAKVVGDIPAKLAQAALQSIEAGEAQVYEGWCVYGAQLLVMRGQLPTDKAFGAWVTANGLDTGRAARGPTRSDAMWLAEHRAEVEAARASGGLQPTVNHPSDIRTAARAAGLACAAPKLRADGTPKATARVTTTVAPALAVVANACAPDALATLQAKYDKLLVDFNAEYKLRAEYMFRLTGYDVMRERWVAREDEFKAELTKAVEKKERELTGDGYQFPKKWARDERFRSLMQLCHPDKHGGSELSVRVTQWLNKIWKGNK